MPSHKKALSDIAACCTKELGGRLYRAAMIAMTRFWSYHCCQEPRPAPKCHGSQARLWLEERQSELLPCDYFSRSRDRPERSCAGASFIATRS